jgi:hypothetical protein
METPMVYAVSDTSAQIAANQGAPSQGVGVVPRPKSRRTAGSISIHWPRVIALGLNTLVWVFIIFVARRALHL